MRFETGDRVVVRPYEEMADEYGVDYYGDIFGGTMPYMFNKRMKIYCGEAGVITGFYNHDVIINFDNPDLNGSHWSFCKEMLELENISDDVYDVHDESSLISFLRGEYE